MPLCPHGRVHTLCPACRPDPRADFIASLGPVRPHRWHAETSKRKIRRSELQLIEQASPGGRRPKVLDGLSSTAYWNEHSKLYPGGSTNSREWGWLRDLVVERDGRRCCICHAADGLQVDHIRPLALGGQNAWENLWTLCRPCHEAKTGRRL